MKHPWKPVTALAASALLSLPAFATGHAGGVEALQRQVQALQQEVTQLRAAVRELQAVEPTITNFMPDFAERFHVLHRAGDSGDWAVASHELGEMQRMMGVAAHIDADKGRLMKAFLSDDFHELGEAIEHEDAGAFDTTMRNTVGKCNACHAAVGSPFVKVTLDVDSSLSMRHPHALRQSEPLVGHTHAHAEGHMQGGEMPMMEEGHHDAGGHHDQDGHAHDEGDGHRD